MVLCVIHILPTLETPPLAISKPIVNLRNEKLAGMILTTETCGFRSKIYGFVLTSLLVAMKTKLHGLTNLTSVGSMH